MGAPTDVRWSDGIEPLTAHQRTWILKERFDTGAELTMADIARLLEVTHNGAKYVITTLEVIGRVEQVNGKYRLMRKSAV